MAKERCLNQNMTQCCTVFMSTVQILLHTFYSSVFINVQGIKS